MMDFLKSKCEDLVEFFICINTVSVVTFILDCNLAGLGTLILEKYHIFVKKSYKKKKRHSQKNYLGIQIASIFDVVTTLIFNKLLAAPERVREVTH